MHDHRRPWRPACCPPRWPWRRAPVPPAHGGGRDRRTDHLDHPVAGARTGGLRVHRRLRILAAGPSSRPGHPTRRRRGNRRRTTGHEVLSPGPRSRCGEQRRVTVVAGQDDRHGAIARLSRPARQQGRQAQPQPPRFDHQLSDRLQGAAHGLGHLGVVTRVRPLSLALDDRKGEAAGGRRLQRIAAAARVGRHRSPARPPPCDWRCRRTARAPRPTWVAGDRNSMAVLAPAISAAAAAREHGRSRAQAQHLGVLRPAPGLPGALAGDDVLRRRQRRATVAVCGLSIGGDRLAGHLACDRKAGISKRLSSGGRLELHGGCIVDGMTICGQDAEPVAAESARALGVIAG